MWRGEGGEEREGKEGRKGGREEGRRYSLTNSVPRRQTEEGKEERKVEAQTDLHVLVTATGPVQGQLLLGICYGNICLASK